MQTFLPYDDFKMCAHVLDDRRLGKQRVEALQILKTLRTGPIQNSLTPSHQFKYKDGLYTRKTPWYNHPAVRMWKGYETALIYYLHAMCYEWTANRKFKDTCWIKGIQVGYRPSNVGVEVTMPPWMGNISFHISHQSNLLRKSKKHYGKFFLNVPDNLPYFWPVG